MSVSVRAVSLNSAPMREGASYVLYWAQMNRRVESNHALLHAAELANRMRLPLLYFESLNCTVPHASDRLHAFILRNVPETARRLREAGIGYAFFLRKHRDQPGDALLRLAANAAAVVTDDYPAFVTRRNNASVPAQLDAACIAVDSSCVVPMRTMEKREWAAYTIRPKIKRVLPLYLKPAPSLYVERRWEGPPPACHTDADEASVAGCDIDHTLAPSIAFAGGRKAAERALKLFLEKALHRYAPQRNEPSAHATSNLSPYLHFGQISSLEVALAARDYAKEHKLIADEFLEELIVRRELSFNFAHFCGDYTSLEVLPDWVRTTIAEHARDRRDPCYTREQFESADTHDPLWNAAQKELLLRGKIHGYYRMYWGKKIIEWSPSAEEALATMIHLNDRYALDGRDPNTYTGILWCFGLHDRPWTERPILGKLRYMSFDGMKRKTDISAYMREIDTIERTGKDPFRVE